MVRLQLNKVTAGSGRLPEPTLEKVILILTANFSVSWLAALQGRFGSFFMSNTFSAFSIPAWRLLSLCHCASFSNSSSLSRPYSTFPHVTFPLLTLCHSLSFCCYFTLGSLLSLLPQFFLWSTSTLSAYTLALPAASFFCSFHDPCSPLVAKLPQSTQQWDPTAECLLLDIGLTHIKLFKLLLRLKV